MKYQDRKFTVSYMSKEYRDNWEAAFGKTEENKTKCHICNGTGVIEIVTTSCHHSGIEQSKAIVKCKYCNKEENNEIKTDE